MKKAKILLVCALFTLSATAQRHDKYDLKNRETYVPTVHSILSHDFNTHYGLRERIHKINSIKRDAVNDYHQTHRYGYGQVQKPQLIFSANENAFSFAIGGSVSLITSYDFGGISNSIDFVPATISTERKFNNRQKLNMDGSTSVIYLKAIANTKALGRIVMYMDTDFRGGAEGAYGLSLKTAYISFLGVTIGRDGTTFSDLSSAPTTVDFEGPNAFTYNYATLIRYERTFLQHRLRAGVALEMPHLSATYGANFKAIPQRLPDVPIYLQYMWDEKKSSHIRASAIFRDLYAYDTANESPTSLLGWGVQFSGNIKCCRWARIMFNGVFGNGITPYIQDLNGSGLDIIPKTSNTLELKAVPMFGAQAAVEINITPRLSTSGGASVVKVYNKNIADDINPYREGVYAFGNIFYKLTPRCIVAGEYLYGSHTNIENMIGYANRINLMLMYHF